MWESQNDSHGVGREPAHVQKSMSITQAPAFNPPERSQTPPWKFWRKLSTRRTDKKPRVTHKANGTSSRLGLHPEWDPRAGQDPDADGDRLGPPPQASLPDVVDKAVLRRSSSLKAPPKPPRLFLFRSSSINNPRSSVDGGSQRNSLVVEGGGQEYGAEVVGDPEPIYVNSAFSAALKTGLSTNDRIIPPTVNNSNNNSIHKDVTATEAERINGGEYLDTFSMFSSSRKGGTLSHSARSNVATVTPTYSTLPHTHHKSQRQKALSPELTLKRTGRSRGRSGDRPDLCRQRHIMHSVVDLLCQRFDPFPLLDDLLVAGVIGEMDVQAFRGHPDRKLICESLANVIGEGESSKLAGFIDVIRAAGQHEEIVRVLDAMRALDRLIHDIPCRSGDGCGDGEEDTQIMADEKMISYEVGYLAPDGMTLRPVVELERVRLADRRLSKRVSRLSASCSAMTETDLGDNILTVPSGPVMMNASVTGHNLSGLRAQALAEVIRQHDCLLELRIGKTQLCSADVAVICEALPDNSSLVSLDIRLNALDHAGAAAVAEMLCRTQSLRQLNLSSTGLDMAGSGVIITALSSCRTLEDLDMSFLDVGDASCEHIRDMLKANSCLQKLRLRSNNFSLPAASQSRRD
ncbi:hypothetical protein C0Q70_15126 [Pomacea canaliculata]|uniref:CARD domain-containing protein n=1 Tax=Pomacea canaliculata TaxID=400727 RepID=A0A2T7NU02_POMCA|nr:hypothetical protein C0Q70_15126 [Pomacea canaliculata]